MIYDNIDDNADSNFDSFHERVHLPLTDRHLSYPIPRGTKFVFKVEGRECGIPEYILGYFHCLCGKTELSVTYLHIVRVRSRYFRLFFLII